MARLSSLININGVNINMSASAKQPQGELGKVNSSVDAHQQQPPLVCYIGGAVADMEGWPECKECLLLRARSPAAGKYLLKEHAHRALPRGSCLQPSDQNYTYFLGSPLVNAAGAGEEREKDFKPSKMNALWEKEGRNPVMIYLNNTRKGPSSTKAVPWSSSAGAGRAAA